MALIALSEAPPPWTGLPHPASLHFRRAWELVHHERFRKELVAIEGQGCESFARQDGALIIEAEFHLTVPQNMIRWWVTVLYHDVPAQGFAAVFTASTCRVAPGAACEGVVARFDPGQWEHYLRTRHEHESSR